MHAVFIGHWRHNDRMGLRKVTDHLSAETTFLDLLWGIMTEMPTKTARVKFFTKTQKLLVIVMEQVRLF